MNILNKYTRETLKKNRSRTIVTIIGIILSMTLFTAVIEGAFSGIEYFKNTVIASEGEFHTVFKDLNKQQAQSVIHDKDIDKAEYTQEVGYGIINSSNEDKPYLRVVTASKNLNKLLKVELIKGRMPKNSSEIVLPMHLQDNGGVNVEVGQTIDIDLGKRFLKGKELTSSYGYFNNEKDGTEELSYLSNHKYKVVGIIERLDRSLEEPLCPGYTAICGGESSGKIDTIVTVKDPVHFSDIEKRIMKENHIMFSNSHKDLLGMYGVWGHGKFASMLFSLSAFLVALVSLGSISLIYNSFAISVGERTRQIGILKSIGATKKQIRSCVLYEASILSLVGIPIGIFVGCTGIGVTLRLLQNMFSNTATDDAAKAVKIHLVINPMMILVAVVICYITVLVAAFIPALRATRISPLEAIKQTLDIKITPKHIRTSKLRFKLFGFEGMMATKNFKRNKKKYRLTIASLCLSIILFVSSSAFCMYMNKAVATQLMGTKYDLSLYLDENNPEIIFEKMKSARDLKKAEICQSLSGSIKVDKSLLTDKYLEAYSNGVEPDSYPVYINFVDDEMFDKLCQDKGLDKDNYYDTKNPRALFVNMLNNVYVKGVLTDLKMFKSDVYEKTFSFISVSPDKSISVLGSVDMSNCIGMYSNGFIFPISMRDHVLTPEELDGTTTQCVFTSSNHKETYKGLVEILRANNRNATYLDDTADLVESTNMLIIIMKVFMFGFIILMSLISLANIFNTISTNIMLRKKEFAMMKSVGLSQRGFKKMLNFECLIYGFRSLSIGLVLSLLICRLLYSITSANVNFGFMIPWQSMIIAIISVFIVVFMSMFYAADKISKDNPIDALRNENL